MQPGQTVEYQTGFADYAIGTVDTFDPQTETLVVRNAVDQTLWRGPVDLASPILSIPTSLKPMRIRPSRERDLGYLSPVAPINPHW